MSRAPDETTGDEAAPVAAECRSCGLAPAPAWDTADGRIHLCPPCSALHDIGCR